MGNHKERMLLNSSDTEYMLLLTLLSAGIPTCPMSFKLSLQEYEQYRCICCNVCTNVYIDNSVFGMCRDCYMGNNLL